MSITSMAAHELQNETLIGSEEEKDTHFDISSTMLHSRSPSPEIFDILEATTVKLAHNMTAFTQLIREKRHSAMFYDQHYMSSEEALSLSPAGEELNLTDEEVDDLEVDDMLEDIMEEDEDGTQGSRSRSNSQGSAVIEQAVEVRFTKVKARRVAQYFTVGSVGTSILSRQASTINSHSDKNSTYSTPESSPEINFEAEKPSVPQRIRPTLQSGWISQASALNPTSSVIPPRKDSLAGATIVTAESSPITPQSVLSTPITPVAKAVTSPITPATPITPTKVSFFNKVGSKLSGLSKKEKHTALRISGPTGFEKLNFTPEALASIASSEMPSSPTVTDTADLQHKTPSKFTPIVANQLPATPVMQVKDSDASSTMSKSSRFFPRKKSINLHRTHSNATTYSLTHKVSSASKMAPRPAAERTTTKDITEFLAEAKNEGSVGFMEMLNASRDSLVTADNASTASIKRKPVPGSAGRDRKRMSFLGLVGHGNARDSSIAI